MVKVVGARASHSLENQPGTSLPPTRHSGQSVWPDVFIKWPEYFGHMVCASGSQRKLLVLDNDLHPRRVRRKDDAVP